MDGSFKASLVALALASFPFCSDAAGLGGISVHSGLGQPLRAEIPVKATTTELDSLSARVGSPEAFRQANVAYSPSAAAVRVSVDRRGSRPVLRLSTDRPLNEPFVELVLELDWAAGRLVRNFTFLLDPIDLAQRTPVAARVDAPAVAPMARPRATEAAPTVVDAGAATRYVVRRGDALHRIASAHQHPGTSLDQMLVAIADANRDAFDGGNMNRLRAGSVLDIPAAERVRALDGTAARREVLAQAADFEAYRRRLAGVAAQAPATPEPAAEQQATGTIVPRVEEARPEVEGDRLRVSSAEQSGTAAGGGDTASRLQTLEEELVSREKSLEDANARLAQLEQSVRDLRTLLELRSEAMGQVEQQAGTLSADAGGASVAAAPPSPGQPAAPAAERPAVEPSLVDDSRLLAGGGAIAALLLGLLAYRSRKRKAEASGRGVPPLSSTGGAGHTVLGTAGGQQVDTGASVLHTEFSHGGLSAIDADEGVDPVAEADVYIAYGRDAQAEEILQDALRTDPERAAIALKLLEIYGRRKSVKQFDLVAADLYARTGGKGPDWSRAAAMGRAIDPDNPLYRDIEAGPLTAAEAPTEIPPLGKSAALAATFAVGGGARASADGGQGGRSAPVAALSDEPRPSEESVLPLEFDLGLDVGETAPAAAGASAKPQPVGDAQHAPDWAAEETVPALAFDIDFDASEAAREQADIRAAATSGLDFELGNLGVEADDGAVEPAAEPAPAGAKPAHMGFDFSRLDFDLELDASAADDATPVPELPALERPSQPDAMEPDATQPGDDWTESVVAAEGIAAGSEEAATKLELARVYDELGDRDGARELLEEVIREGSLGQQAAARQMLARFG
ncbi:MAG: hypothetical protein GX576_00480 [Thauera phenolivorans]|uniref:LysM domain-containing protein n=1 Tax=Thauera phenolivorans TaxID=1792543 RepID=A0A7X7LT17_9RHOO|nr:FimV/HubP family polar landmark protein [Thauera phenolivorans]NLF52879.1 hypothetical protein [Thauera phenolivorans]